MDYSFLIKGKAWIFLINSRKGSDNSEKEGSWTKMRGENFQGWVEMLPTFGDVLNCNQNGLKNKGYYNNVSALYSYQSLLKHCLIKN